MTLAEVHAAQEADDSGELPEGWTRSTVRKLVEINYGKGLKASARSDGQVAVYGSNGIVGSHAAALTSGPTVILGRKGTVGAVHYSRTACWPIDTTYFIDEFYGLDAMFLVHLLRGLNLADLDTSTAIPGLNRDDVYRQVAALPPLAEQRRIVAKVEELLAQVNAARERLARTSALLKRFRQSVLGAACDGRLTADWREDGSPNGDLPDAWRWVDLKHVCLIVADCPHSTPRWSIKGEICLRTTNFRPGLLDLSEVRYVSEETYLERTKRVEPLSGDIVYSREGGILGIAAIIPAGARVCLGQRMMLMRTDPDQYVPTFLMHVLNSATTLQRVAELTGGSASPHLNVGDIKALHMPLAPLPEQHEIVRRVDALFALADAIESRVAAAAARAERLTQSILARAFRGELVPTEAELARREGTEYEPASVLLERIRAQRRPPTAQRHKLAGGC